MSTYRAVATLLIVGFFLGSVWPLGGTDRATALTPIVVGDPLAAPLKDGGVRVLARYATWNDLPTEDHFRDLGILARYRFQAVPAWILEGSQEQVRRLLSTEAGLTRIEYDRPLEYFLDTATFATNAVDVWGGAWWPTPVARKNPSPLTVEGVVIDGRGVTVGVVDSGINALHPDLWYSPLHLPGMPWAPKVLECTNVALVFEPDLGNPYCDESVGHGTHVAGIVAGTGWAARNGLAPLQDPDTPYVGAAPGASLVGAGLGAADQILLASVGLDWMYANAEEFGIRVVTNSWGDRPGCAASMPAATDIVVELTDALVKDKGIVVLYAASNYVGTTPTWTSTYARNPTPGVISVANYAETGDALNQQGNRNGKINSGSSDGCVASGGAGDYLWTWPDVAAPGTSIASTAAYTGVLIPPTWDPGMYASASGTSMATPHVAGIVALMLQANPDLTPAEVERILVETSTPWPNDGVSARGRVGTTMWSASPDSCYVTPTDAARAEAGDTGVNAKFPLFTTLASRTDAALFVCRDFKRGAGLVDAYAAVQASIDDPEDPDPLITISAPANGSRLPAGIVDFAGTVSRPIPGPEGEGGVLYLVGDGSTTVLTDADQVTNFGLSSLGHGNRDTRYATAAGNNAVPRNPFMPTFIGAERVHLSGAPITLRAHLLYTGAVNLVGNICPVDAGLFDAAGNTLTTAPARAYVTPDPDFQEAVFEFVPKAGTYEGLMVQVGASGLDCGRFPQVWRWGTDAFNGRLVLSSADWIGSEPSAGSEERVELFVDGSAEPAAGTVVATRTDGADTWTIPLDFTLSPGPHTVEARWGEDETLLDSATTAFIIESAREPGLTITQPPEDGLVLRGESLLLGGGHSTSGGGPWSVDARIVALDGTVLLDWTRAALPPPDVDGTWSIEWRPGEQPDAAVRLEARLQKAGADQATAQRSFQYDAPNVPPLAGLMAPAEGHRDVPVGFDGTSSRDPDGGSLSYEWEFGDGSTASGARVDHVYSSLGLFRATLTVTDSEGGTDTAEHLIDIDNAPPTARFTGPSEVRRNRDAAFDATGSTDPDGSIRSYLWDFGDGEGGVGARPTHRYKQDGTYVVTLTVVDNDLRASEATATIVVTR